MAVQIVSIHDMTADGRVLAFDLKHVLDALATDVADLRFLVHALDATGPGADDAHARVDAAGALGLWLSFEELANLAAGIRQAIDAEIFAYRADTDPAQLVADDVALAKFPTNRMVLAILAVDSSFFEVYAKDRQPAERIAARFRDVRSEDPSRYF